MISLAHMNRKTHLPQILLTAGIIITISLALIYLQRLIGTARIEAAVDQAGIFGPLVLIGLMVLTYIVAPIQGAPFVLLAFTIYGKWTVIYLYLASVVSSFTNFWIARKFGRHIVTKLVGKSSLTKIDHIATHEGYKALVIMRFFQGFIHDFVSYAAGLTPMDFRKYYLISLVVPLPWTIGTFIFFDQIPSYTMLPVAWAAGSIFFIIPPVYYYFKHKFTPSKTTHTS